MYRPEGLRDLLRQDRPDFLVLPSKACAEAERQVSGSPLSTVARNWTRLIHREALKEETVAIVVNLMKEQAATPCKKGSGTSSNFSNCLLIDTPQPWSDIFTPAVQSTKRRGRALCLILCKAANGDETVSILHSCQLLAVCVLVVMGAGISCQLSVSKLCVRKPGQTDLACKLGMIGGGNDLVVYGP